MRRTDVLNPRNHYPQTWISRNTSRYASIKEKLTMFCTANSIDSIQIFTHHITLRSMKPFLSFLSGTDTSSEQGLFSFLLCQSDEYFPFVVGSPLCDTKGCISKNHLIIKTSEENRSRQKCFGIIIQMYEKSSGN